MLFILAVCIHSGREFVRLKAADALVPFRGQLFGLFEHYGIERECDVLFHR